MITGRGRHSQDNKPKIKPAVEKFLSDNQYVSVHMCVCINITYFTLCSQPVGFAWTERVLVK